MKPAAISMSIPHSITYFPNEVERLGNDLLVGLNQFHLSNMAKKLDKKEVSFHMLMTKFVFALHRGQQDEFAVEVKGTVIQKQVTAELTGTGLNPHGDFTC